MLYRIIVYWYAEIGGSWHIQYLIIVKESQEIQIAERIEQEIEEIVQSSMWECIENAGIDSENNNNIEIIV